MGLKCRLLGHAYGEPEVERSREEKGDEVVVTVRELQVCERCGDEQTVSQNKEVTAIRSPAEVGLDDATSATAGDAGTAANPSAPEGTPSGSRADAFEGPDGTTTGTPESDDSPVEAAEPAVDASTEADGDAGAADADAGAAGDDAANDVEEAIDWVDEAESDGADAGVPDAESDSAAGGDGWETGSGEWDDEPDPDADDAVILDDEETERDETQWPEETEDDPVRAARRSAEESDGPDAAVEEPEEQVTNDAEIIDGDGDAVGGGAEAGASGDARGADAGEGAIGYDPDRSAWPERDDAPGGERADETAKAGNGTAPERAWPDHDGDDEGFAAATGADADLEFGGNGLTPEVNGRAPAENGTAESVDGVAVGDATGAARVGRDEGDGGGFVRTSGSEALESDVPDDRVEFYCPNCGHNQTAGATSLRAGDICPKCKQGYIAARER